MNDEKLTKAQLLREVRRLRRQVLKLEAREKDLAQKEKALAETAALHRSVSELVADRIFRVIPGAQGRISIEWLLGDIGAITGYTETKTVSISDWKRIVHPDDWKKVDGFRQAVLGGKKHDFEMRVLDNNGNVVWMNVIGQPEWDDDNRRVKAMLCCAREITRTKTIEEDSRRRAAYFRSSVETMLDGFGIITAVRDQSGQIVDFTMDYLNPAGLVNSPLSKEDVIGKGIRRSLSGARAVEFFEKLRVVAETGVPMLRETLVYEDVYQGKNRVRTFEVNAVRLGDSLSGTWRDVTDRKRAEKEARLAHERLEYLVSATPAVIYTAEPGGDYGATFVSKNVLQTMGYGPEEFVTDSRFWIDRVHPDDRRRLMDELPHLFEEDRYTYEYRFQYKDGRYSWVRDEMKLVRDGDGKPLEIVGYWTDITERKRTEDELIRLERLRALGQMAAGVSHNLNNILTTILGPAKLLQQEIDDPELLRETEFILTSARRAKDLVKRLNEAVRGGQETGLGPVSVNKAVREAVEITRPIWKDEAEGRNVSIELTTDLGEVPLIRGTHYGLNDMVMNLLLNAVDALPKGGKIAVRTEAEGDEVRLIVSDTGQGMDEDTRRRAFEPFFSTKLEIGTGLGLSTVYGTATRWGGSVDVKSSPGEGTTFTIRLPAWTGSEVREKAGAPDAHARRARILIVEDVEPICALLSRLLSGDHDVDVVLSGREALERFSPDRYDVAIIDLGLSGITGDRVGRLMRQADTSLATILISGWDFSEGDPRVAPFDFWLGKPFDDLRQVEAVVTRAIELHDARDES